VEDYNNNGSYPTSVEATTFPAASAANWMRDPISDTGAGGFNGNGECDAGEDCVYKDLVTSQSWAKGTMTNITNETAITTCDSLNYGTFNDWRVPTHKEFAQALIDGIWSVREAAKLNFDDRPHWTSTTKSDVTGDVWVFEPRYMYTIGRNRTSDTLGYLCIRP
jgi:Protein of unknown function (DUF1566)